MTWDGALLAMSIIIASFFVVRHMFHMRKRLEGVVQMLNEANRTINKLRELARLETLFRRPTEQMPSAPGSSAVLGPVVPSAPGSSAVPGPSGAVVSNYQGYGLRGFTGSSGPSGADFGFSFNRSTGWLSAAPTGADGEPVFSDLTTLDNFHVGWPPAQETGSSNPTLVNPISGPMRDRVFRFDEEDADKDAE